MYNSRRKINLFLMIRRAIQQHALSSIITAISVALGCGLVLAVWLIKIQSYQAFTGGAIGFDAVLGARGSQLQLVLNTVFHLETSAGNIPWSLYKQIENDPRVRAAVPYALGDNYYGYRIVGTSTQLFTHVDSLLIRNGRLFKENAPEAVVGHLVAKKMGLTVGAQIHPYHGLNFDLNAKHDQTYNIVGILEPSNTPADRVIWIPIESVFRVEGHVLRGSGEIYRAESGQVIPDKHKEVSAVMLKLSSPQVGFFLDQMINKQGTVATIAWPIGKVMANLFDKIGWMNRVMEMVAYLVMVVAGFAILAAIYNTINERQREFAIMRALGASRKLVFSVILFEAGTIALIGSFIGYLIYGLIFVVTTNIIQHRVGVVLDPLNLEGQALIIVLILPVATTMIGLLAGIVPAFKAYQTDVATNLIPRN